MADEPNTTINGIGLALTLDTSQYDAALTRADARRKAFIQSAGGAGTVTAPLRRGPGTVGASAYLPGGAGGGGSRVGAGIGVSPTLTAGSAQTLRTELRRVLTANPIPISVTLGRSSFSQIRRDITERIGVVPINVSLGGGSKGGTLDVVTAIVARASGLSKAGALSQIRQSMAQIGADPRALEGRASGGPVLPNRSYLVGERGREVFTPRTAGIITPEDDPRLTAWIEAKRRRPRQERVQRAEIARLSRKFGVRPPSVVHADDWDSYGEATPPTVMGEYMVPERRIYLRRVIPKEPNVGAVPGTRGPKAAYVATHEFAHHLLEWNAPLNDVVDRAASADVYKEDPYSYGGVRFDPFGLPSLYAVKARHEAAAEYFTAVMRQPQSKWTKGTAIFAEALKKYQRRWSGGRALAYAQTMANSGGTFDPMGHQPGSGYAVALAHSEVEPTDRLAFIRAYHAALRGVQGGLAPYVGTWLDPDTGMMTVDPSTVVRSRARAQALGRIAHQKAYYDLLRHRDYPIHYPIHEAYGGNVLGLRGLARGGEAFSAYRQRVADLAKIDMAMRGEGDFGTPEERLALLKRLGPVADILGASPVPVPYSATRGATRSVIPDIIHIMASEASTVGSGSDIKIARALKALPAAMHEPGMAQKFWDKKTLAEARPMSGGLASAWLRGLGFDRQFASPGSDDLASLAGIMNLSPWDQGMSIAHGFGFSKNAMGGMVKPISYGAGFAHMAAGGTADPEHWIEMTAAHISSRIYDYMAQGYDPGMAQLFAMLDFQRRMEKNKALRIIRAPKINPFEKGEPDFPGLAAGGSAPRGVYVVNENGRELFVPKRLQDRIPADVMAKISHRGSGGIAEINQPPWSLFYPPEDGWIVPANLKNRVPRAAGGAEYDKRLNPKGGQFRNTATGQIIGRQEAQKLGITNVTYGTGARTKGLATGEPGAINPYVPQQRVATNLARDLVTSFPRTIGQTTAASITAFLRENQQPTGRTPRTSVGAEIATLVGGRARAKAINDLQESERIISSFAKVLGPGVEPLDHFRELQQRSKVALDNTNVTLANHIHNLKGSVTEATREDEGLKGLIKTRQSLRNTEKVSAQAVTTLTDAYAKAEKSREIIQRPQFAKNFLAQTAAFTAYGASLQLIGFVEQALVPGISRAFESATGYAATEQRVTEGLAGQLPSAGGSLSLLFSQTAVQHGIGEALAGALQQTLGGSVLAKAAATNETQVGDLVRASIGAGKAPTGLIGAYGGLLGGPAFAEQLGGGLGFYQEIARTIGAAGPAAASDQQKWAALTNQYKGAKAALTPAPQAVAAVTGYANDLNAAYGRGIAVQGKVNDGLGIFNVGIDKATAAASQFTKAQAVAAGLSDSDAQQFVDSTNTMAAAGFALRDSTGNVVTDINKYIDYLNGAAQGRQLPTVAEFKQLSSFQVQAQKTQNAINQQLTQQYELPFQFGAALASQPFLPGQAAAGYVNPSQTGYSATQVFGKGGDKFAAGITTQLKSAQADMDSLMKQSDQWISQTTDTITKSLGAEQGGQFSMFMTQVKDAGTAISTAELAVTTTTHALNVAQLANNLRLAGRALSDALGLAGKATGPNNLGEIEREQTLLGFNLQQREINLNLATAGFQNPGETPEERAARQEAAVAQAKITQQQLSLQEQAFKITASRGVVDTGQSIALIQKAQEAEATSYAAGITIAVEQQKQAIAMANATAIFQHAMGDIQATVTPAIAYIQQYGIAAARADGITQDLGTQFISLDDTLRNILNLPTYEQATSGSRSKTGTTYTGKATGDIFNTTGVTGPVIFGEAGKETVAILRNPRPMQLGSLGGGAGGGVTINLAINNPTVQKPEDIATLARTVRDELDRALRLAGLR